MSSLILNFLIFIASNLASISESSFVGFLEIDYLLLRVAICHKRVEKFLKMSNCWVRSPHFPIDVANIIGKDEAPLVELFDLGVNLPEFLTLLPAYVAKVHALVELAETCIPIFVVDEASGLGIESSEN
jgi:hypothetical protein